MARPKRSPVPPATTTVLIADVPVEVHRAMKAEAARRGVRLKDLYAAACREWLEGRTGRKGGK